MGGGLRQLAVVPSHLGRAAQQHLQPVKPRRHLGRREAVTFQHKVVVTSAAQQGADQPAPTTTASATSSSRIHVHRHAIFMAALWNRAGHYIFALWFLLSFLLSSFFPRLISAIGDWMSGILAYMVRP